MAKCRYCGQRAIMFSDICSECWNREQEAARRSHEAAIAAAAPATTATTGAADAVPDFMKAYDYRNVEAYALHHPGPLSLTIVGMCVVVAFLTLVGDSESTWARVYAWGAQINEEVDAGEWWRLLSGPFLHGSWSHLIGNMYGLWVVGSLVERAFGGDGLLVIYVLSALGGSIASYFFVPAPTVGASGAIFGLFGAALWRIGRRGVITGVSVSPKELKALGLWAAYSLFMGFTHTQVNNAAHLGGLATGVLVAAALPVARMTRGAAILCATLLLMTGTRMALSSREVPRVAAYLRALEAGGRNDIPAALLELNHAVPLPEALELRAGLRLSQKDFQGALQDTDALLAIRPRGERRRALYYFRAQALLNLGRPAEAYATLRPAMGSKVARRRELVDGLRRDILLAVPDSGVPGSVRDMLGLEHKVDSGAAAAR